MSSPIPRARCLRQEPKAQEPEILPTPPLWRPRLARRPPPGRLSRLLPTPPTGRPLPPPPPPHSPSTAALLRRPPAQIRAYVEDVIRSAIPVKTLDEAFSSKDQLALAVKDQLTEEMERFGYHIVKALVTDLTPDKGVKNSMNEINAQRRLKDAATAKADAEKILLVKAAEADKESKYLSGLGVAMQRK